MLYLDGRGVKLEPGACGAVPVGTPHAFRCGDRALWIEMASPRPRADGSDTFFLGPAPDGPAAALDARDPRNHNLFLLTDGRDGSRSPEARPGDGRSRPCREAWRLPSSPTAGSPSRCSSTSASTPSSTRCSWSTTSREPAPIPTTTRSRSRTTCSRARSTSSRTATATRSGPATPSGRAPGCVHAFYETQGGRVRWLETSAPGPPARHSYRHERDWELPRGAAGLRRGRRSGVSHVSDTAGDGRPRRPRPVHAASTGRCSSSAASRTSSSRCSSRGEVYGTTHLYSGQEAIAIGCRERPRASATAWLRRTADTATRSRSESTRRRCSTRCSAARPASTAAGRDR